MRNSILNEKMRIVDLGVAVCIDGILKGTEILLDETTSEAQKEQAKEQVKKYAGIYQQALAELIEALDDESQADKANRSRNGAGSFITERKHLLLLEQAETLSAEISNQNALVSLYKNYTAIMPLLDKNYLLGEINQLSQIHQVYLQHLEQQAENLLKTLKGEDLC